MKAILGCMLFAWIGLAAASQTPTVYGRLTGRLETGKVRKVNKDLITFSPLAGGPDITVRIGAQTRLTKQNNPARLKDIKRGKIVRVSFPLGQGTVTAESVALLDKKDIPQRKTRK
jgi:hypothetical protein